MTAGVAGPQVAAEEGELVGVVVRVASFQSGPGTTKRREAQTRTTGGAEIPILNPNLMFLNLCRQMLLSNLPLIPLSPPNPSPLPVLVGVTRCSTGTLQMYV